MILAWASPFNIAYRFRRDEHEFAYHHAGLFK